MPANKSSRRRRAPEQARAEILDAATELIAERGPDGATLSQIAAAAGVTHGLVSHYFGTYRRLVSAVLARENERHRDRIRAQMQVDEGVPRAVQIVDVLFESLADERYVRLWTWARLHPDHHGLPGGQLTGLVDAMQQGITAVLGDRGPDRDRIEAVVLLGMSAAYGYALGGTTWQAALGHDPTDPERANALRRSLSTALADYLVAGPD